MSQDTTSRPSTEETARPAAFLPCSDCRSPMRSHYFALDTRPVCPKCRMGYEKRIVYGTGPGSLGRMLLWGGGVALAGAVVLGVFGFMLGILRLLLSSGVAYFVAKAINKATGDYYQRRNQVVAVLLVWFAVSTAAIVPIVVAAVRAKPAAAAPAVPVDSATTAAADEDGADLEAALREQQVPPAPQSMEDRKAAELRSGGVAKAVLILVVLFLTLPLISAFGIGGVYAAGMSLLALGFALVRAWQWTSDGVSYQLSGPHRVGTGPVPNTF